MKNEMLPKAEWSHDDQPEKTMTGMIADSAHKGCERAAAMRVRLQELVDRMLGCEAPCGTEVVTDGPEPDSVMDGIDTALNNWTGEQDRIDYLISRLEREL